MPSQATLSLLIQLKDEASRGLGSIGGSLRTLGTIGLGVAAGGVAAFGAALISGIGDAREAAKVYGQTEQVIKSTGGAAGFSAQQIKDMAGSLSAAAGQSLFGDDDIERGQNMLLTFTNIKETLPDTTKIMLDMAQALGTDAGGAAIQLGKALNDPIKGISALTRVGVTFTDEQKKQIKALQDAGDMAGAQKVILAELNKEFGGSALAAAQADGGWAQFTDRMGEAKEAMGAAVLPLLTQLAGVLNDTIAPAIETAAAAFAAWLSDPATQASLQALGQAITTGIGVAFDFIANTAIPALISAWATLQPAIALVQGLFAQAGDSASGMGTTFDAVAQTISAVMAVIAQVVSAVLVQVAAFWQAHGAEIMAFVKETWATIMQIVQVAMQLIQATIVPALVAIAGFISAHGQEIQTVLSAVWTIISTIISTTLAIIKGVLTAALQAIHGDWSGAWETIKGTLATVWEGIKTIVGAALELVKAELSMAWDAIKGTLSSAWEGIKGALQSVLDGLVSAIKALPGQVAGVGAAVVQMIWDGLERKWNEFVSDLRAKLQGLRDMLPFSEPKDSSSPLYGLAESGRAIIEMLVSGMQSAGTALSDTMAALGGDATATLGNTLDNVRSLLGDSDLPDQAATLGDGLMSQISSGIEGRVGDVLGTIQSAGRQISDALADVLGDWLGGGTATGSPGFGSAFAGGRATGGRVRAGSAYLVGERGPELFSPGTSGSITPNNALGGTTIFQSGAIVVNAAPGQNERQIAEMVVREIDRKLRSRK